MNRNEDLWNNADAAAFASCGGGISGRPRFGGGDRQRQACRTDRLFHRRKVEKIIKEDSAYGTKHKLVLSDFTRKFVFTSNDFSFSCALIGVLPGITDAVLLAKPGELKGKDGKSVSYYDFRVIIEDEILSLEPIFGK